MSFLVAHPRCWLWNVDLQNPNFMQLVRIAGSGTEDIMKPKAHGSTDFPVQVGPERSVAAEHFACDNQPYHYHVFDLLDPLRKLCDGTLTARLRTGQPVECRKWCSWSCLQSFCLWMLVFLVACCERFDLVILKFAFVDLYTYSLVTHSQDLFLQSALCGIRWVLELHLFLERGQSPGWMIVLYRMLTSSTAQSHSSNPLLGQGETFYDSVSGKALFVAPKGRSWDEFEKADRSSHVFAFTQFTRFD